MQPSLREQNKKRNRAEILRAARRLFNMNGYENTMMTDVASKAMVSKATLYNYFPNKESLLRGISEEVVEKLRKKALQTSALKLDERIRCLLQFHMQDIHAYIPLARRIVLINANLYDSAPLSDESLQTLVSELVIEGQESGIFHKDVEAPVMVDLIMGIFYTALFDWKDIRLWGEEELQNQISKRLDAVLSYMYAAPPEHCNGE